MRNNEGGSEMSTPVSEYMRTLTTKGHQSLIEWRQRLGEQIDVQDVLFRMLEPHEIQRGMALPTNTSSPVRSGIKFDS